MKTKNVALEKLMNKLPSNLATFEQGTLYYLLREQDRLTILKFFYHPEHTKSTLFA